MAPSSSLAWARRSRRWGRCRQNHPRGPGQLILWCQQCAPVLVQVHFQAASVCQRRLQRPMWEGLPDVLRPMLHGRSKNPPQDPPSGAWQIFWPSCTYIATMLLHSSRGDFAACWPVGVHNGCQWWVSLGHNALQSSLHLLLPVHQRSTTWDWKQQTQETPHWLKFSKICRCLSGVWPHMCYWLSTR